MRGGYYDNPTVQSFLKATVSFRVQGSMATKPMRGNCKCDKENEERVVNDEPLPTRQHVQSKQKRRKKKK